MLLICSSKHRKMQKHVSVVIAIYLFILYHTPSSIPLMMFLLKIILNFQIYITARNKNYSEVK